MMPIRTVFIGRPFVDDGHERAGHAGRIVVLNDIAPVHDSGGALFDELFRAQQDLGVGRFAAAAHQNGNAARNFDDVVVKAHVVGGIGLDDIRTELDALAYERDDLFRIAIDHVAAGLGIGPKNEGLDHERHREAITLGLQLADVLNALIRNLGLPGNLEEIHDHAGRVEPQRLLDGMRDHPGKKSARKLAAINVCNVRTQNESGLLLPRNGLQSRSLANRELNRIRPRGDERLHAAVEMLDAREKRALVEKAVVDGDIEAAPGARMK
jgi:hypothetical protein